MQHVQTIFNARGKHGRERRLLASFWTFFWSILWLFLLVAWFWVLISVIADVFRSRDLSGGAKAGGVLFVILIPWLGVLAYILIRGGKMEENNVEATKSMETAQREYIRKVAAISLGEEWEKLLVLKEKGALTEDKFAEQKRKLLMS